MNKVVLSFVIFCSTIGFYSFVGFATNVSDKSIEVSKKKEPIVLTSPLFDIIDGVFVDGNTFHLIIKSRFQVRKRLFGVLVADKQRVGFYDFAGKKCFLSELISLERQLGSKEDVESKAKLDDLKKLLLWAKEDFITFTSEYMDSAKGMKKVLLGIMKEFHEKSGLGEFFLLEWVRVPDGGEMESARRNVKSFGDLKKLMTEMEGFLDAMAHSCPKGEIKFNEMKKEFEARSAAGKA